MLGNYKISEELKSPFETIDELCEDARYALHPKYRFRRDCTRIILFAYSSPLGILDGSYKILHPRIAILLSLFDGRRTYSEVVEAFRFVMDDETPIPKAKEALKKVLKDLLKDRSDLLVRPLPGFKNYLRCALSSIKNLQDAGIPVRVKVVATSLNIDGIPRLIRELVSRNVASILIDAYGRSLFRHSNALFATNKSIESCISEISRIRDQSPNTIIMSNLRPYTKPNKKEREQKWKGRSACSSGRSSITIMTDGTIIVCDQVPIEGGFMFGSVRNKSIEEAWKSEMKLAVYPAQNTLNEPCRFCEEFVQCCNEGGRCLRDVYIAFKTTVDGDPKCPKVDIPLRY